MTAEPAPGKQYFTAPAHPNQRRYEALRAYFTEDLTVAEAGARAGYTRASMASLLRDFRAGLPHADAGSRSGEGPGRHRPPAGARTAGRAGQRASGIRVTISRG